MTSIREIRQTLMAAEMALQRLARARPIDGERIQEAERLMTEARLVLFRCDKQD